MLYDRSGVSYLVHPTQSLPPATLSSVALHTAALPTDLSRDKDPFCLVLASVFEFFFSVSKHQNASAVSSDRLNFESCVIRWPRVFYIFLVKGIGRSVIDDSPQVGTRHSCGMRLHVLGVPLKNVSDFV